MTPAFALVEASIVADGFQVARAGVDELLELPVGHERLDTVKAYDLRERQRSEWPLHAGRVRVIGGEPHHESFQDSAGRCGSELLVSQPFRQRFERDAVAQLRIIAAEAGQQIERKRLPARFIRHREPVSLQIHQLLA